MRLRAHLNRLSMSSFLRKAGVFFTELDDHTPFKEYKHQEQLRQPASMGYAGYTAAKLPPPLPSAVQSALWAVPSQESLEIIEKLTKNVAVNPTEEKFKRIRLTNNKIKAALVDVPGAVDALLALGWARDEDEEALIVPKGRYFSMAEVRLIDEARDRLRKRERDAARTKPSCNPSNEATAQIRAQMEADRRERAAKEPVTKGSVAQKLGSGNSMMATPKDIGCTDC